MSGTLGEMLGGLLGGSKAGQPSAISGILQQVLTMKDAQGNSGIGALVSQFQSAGLGHVAQSWVGTGSNAPVSTDQVGQVFSPAQISGWAKQAGTTPDAMRDVLAQALPHVVDHMTPAGQVPPPNADLAGMLSKLLAGQGGMRQA